MSALRDLVLDAWKQADHILLVLCIAASSYGIVLIYSATQFKTAFHSFAMKQGIAMCIGIVCYFVVSQFNIDVLRTHWKLTAAFSTALILAILTPLGHEVLGNRAWLQIPHLTFFTIQPAEIDKVFFAILLAHLIIYLKRKRRINHPISIVTLGAVLCYFVGLIFVITRDAGSCLIYVFMFAFMLWGAGVSSLWFAAGFGAVAAAAYAIWPKIPDNEAHKKRILAVLDHNFDPLDANFHQDKSILAVRSGGLTGQGYMKGVLTQASLNQRLPERYSDFIFSSCCEEWGLLGAAVVIVLLMAIIFRILYVGITCADPFSSLVCIGYAGMFFTQIWFNIGMCLYVMPVIGVTLPFFSYGGTSIMVNFMIMGVVSGIRNRSEPGWLKHSDTPEIQPEPEQKQPRPKPRKSVLYSPAMRQSQRRRNRRFGGK